MLEKTKRNIFSFDYKCCGITLRDNFIANLKNILNRVFFHKSGCDFKYMYFKLEKQ